MASNIFLKKSSVPGKSPETADLSYGELAINYADGKLFFKASDNSIQVLNDLDQVTANGNTTTNGITVGSISVTGEVTSANAVQFDTGATGITHAAGKMHWNDVDGTVELGMKGGNILQQIGLDQYVRVHNDNGTTIPSNTVVYQSGAVNANDHVGIS